MTNLFGIYVQVSGAIIAELFVNMHCDTCSQQLRKGILTLRGITLNIIQTE